MKTKSNKPVNRTASIINRSKLLVLSDSESDGDQDMSTFDKRCSKHIRLSKQKIAMNWRIKSSGYSKMLAKGKRKRNSTQELLTLSNVAPSTSVCSLTNIFAPGPSGLQGEQRQNIKPDSMDIECDQFEETEEDSDLSDESPTECNFDGDDEQSDFYDSSSVIPPSRCRNRIYCHTRPKLEFKIPTNPSNPFWSVTDLEPHQSINLWKRRRPLH